jgi:hypothetical protein
LKDKTMKVLIWVVFGVLMALWTGFAAMSAGLVGWLLSTVADGQISGAAQAVGQWPIPAWLAVWVDPGMVENIQATWLNVVQTLGQWVPSASALTGWVVPLLWVVWGLISLCLLAAAGAGHWLAGKSAAH